MQHDDIGANTDTHASDSNGACDGGDDITVAGFDRYRAGRAEDPAVRGVVIGDHVNELGDRDDGRIDGGFARIIRN